MKKQILAAAGLAVVLAAPGFAQEGWYVTGGVGYGWTPEMDVEIDSATYDIEGEGDYRFMLGAGYDFGSNWRVQVDVMDRFNDTGAVGDINPGESDLQNVAAMVSGIYDFENASRFTPYAGLGVGYSQVEFSAWVPGDLADPLAGPGEYLEGDGRGLSAQGLLGVGVGLTERLTADVGYRYFYGPDVTVGSAADVDNYQSHDVLFGLRYAFGQPARAAAPPAPPPQPTAPTAPAVACSDVPFVVYFEWDRADLTDQARDVIARAAQQAATCDITRVEIEGHTDRSGSASYNVRLSERRARVVRDELIRLGVPASLISIEARGETEPAVATPDGAREPLNRRSEVVIRVM